MIFRSQPWLFPSILKLVFQAIHEWKVTTQVIKSVPSDAIPAEIWQPPPTPSFETQHWWLIQLSNKNLRHRRDSKGPFLPHSSLRRRNHWRFGPRSWNKGSASQISTVTRARYSGGYLWRRLLYHLEQPHIWLENALEANAFVEKSLRFLSSNPTLARPPHSS